jgi:hypothetical protein
MKRRQILLLLGSCACSGNAKNGENTSGDGAPGMAFTWEWILDADALPSPPPDVDYLGVDAMDVPADYIATAESNGVTTWCYLSVGTAEEWRDDYDDFLDLDAADRADGNPGLVGEIYPEWPDERWLNARRFEPFMHLIEARLDTCADKGFSWVEFDNMDAFEATTGFDITRADQRTYVEALVAASNARGLGTIHKNATGLATALVPLMDALLLEGCVLYDFCEEAAPYLSAGKPVMNAEYPEEFPEEGVSFDASAVCTASAEAGVNTLLKELSLNAETERCSDLGAS